jgi:NTP pyrophosphatase (non-canonical NTP hydrolase)
MNHTALAELGKTILEINRGNGWNVMTPEDWPEQSEADPLKKYRIPASIALVHSELSEALEGFRKLDRANFAEELADVLIRTLDLACGLGIDIDAEVKNKLEKNRSRGYRHGGKVV